MQRSTRSWEASRRRGSRATASARPPRSCGSIRSAGLETISTHEQVLGGATGQLYLGAEFPGPRRISNRHSGGGAARRPGASRQGRARALRRRLRLRARGRDAAWRHRAIEINLRKGGTTHTFQMLQYLTDGHYDAASGLFRTQQDQLRFYYATDNLVNPHYRRLTPTDLDRPGSRARSALRSGDATGRDLQPHRCGFAVRQAWHRQHRGLSGGGGNALRPYGQRARFGVLSRRSSSTLPICKISTSCGSSRNVSRRACAYQSLIESRPNNRSAYCAAAESSSMP